MECTDSPKDHSTASDASTFKPRLDDPRAGYGGLTFVDYSQPIAEPIQFRYIRRHRLEKCVRRLSTPPPQES